MKNLIFLISLATLISCGEPDNNSGIDFNDFRNAVKSTAGNDAIDCGQVEISSSQLSANTCAADSFLKQAPFFAIYKLRGIDSSFASGIAVGKDNIVYFLFFDSDPSGGGKKNNGYISKTECKNAEYLGNADVNYYDLFSCN